MGQSLWGQTIMTLAPVDRLQLPKNASFHRLMTLELDFQRTRSWAQMHHDVRDLYLVKCNLSVPGRGPISLMITQLLITNTLGRTIYKHRKELGCIDCGFMMWSKVFKSFVSYIIINIICKLPSLTRSSLVLLSLAWGDGKITNACISQTPDQRHSILQNLGNL